MDKDKYISTRKKLLKEHSKLFIEKMKISKSIRDINKELNCWDKVLFEDD